jgi:hypothetical protein
MNDKLCEVIWPAGNGDMRLKAELVPVNISHCDGTEICTKNRTVQPTLKLTQVHFPILYYWFTYIEICWSIYLDMSE